VAAQSLSNVRRSIAVRLAVLLAACCTAAPADQVLYRGKSRFNDIIVTQDDQGMRTLYFEFGGARQSVVKVGDPEHLELAYARTAMSALALCPKPERILVVGLGGGTIPMFLRKQLPKTHIDAVEIDPEVISVAKRFFGFREDERMKAYAADGRRYIEQTRLRYDIVFLDAFGADNVPYDLATVEFLRAVRAILTPRGLAVANIWSRDSNPLYDSMVRTYQEAFDSLYIVKAPYTANRILLALPRRENISRADMVRRASAIAATHRFRFDLGSIIEDGFAEAPPKDPSARILRDRNKPR
jgi:spermidine synthase